jgi:DNA-binding CsgD family transcriptional regulator
MPPAPKPSVRPANTGLAPGAPPSGVRARAAAVRTTADPARIAVAAQAWGLTARQVDVLRRAVTGDGNKEIAAELGCAEVTVEFHMTALLRKASAGSRAQLVVRFFELA